MMFSNSSNHLKNILLSKTYEFLSLFIMPLGGGRLAVFNNYNSFKASFVGVIGDITLSSDEDVKLVLEKLENKSLCIDKVKKCIIFAESHNKF